MNTNNQYEMKRFSNRKPASSSSIHRYESDTGAVSGDPEHLHARQRAFVRPQRSPSHQKRMMVASHETRNTDNFYRAQAEARRRQEMEFLQTTVTNSDDSEEKKNGGCCSWSCWSVYVAMASCCCFPFCLRKCGKTDKMVQHAWREKIALCVIIVFAWMILAFITFGLNWVLCKPTFARALVNQPPAYEAWGIKGRWYNVPDAFLIEKHTTSIQYIDQFRRSGYRDVSNVFMNSFSTPSCTEFGVGPESTCYLVGGYSGPCHTVISNELLNAAMDMDVAYTWDNVADKNSYYFVYNGIVLDLLPYYKASLQIFGPVVHQLIETSLHIDATKIFTRNEQGKKVINCLVEKYQTGFVNKESPGCFSAAVFNVITLIIILGLVFTRFFMALIYAWLVAPRLSRKPDSKKIYAPPGAMLIPGTIETSLHVMMLVTCYSEDEVGIRCTLESLAETEYPDDQKLIFMVADGIVTGGGNNKSTPDICASLFTHLEEYESPEAKSYVAIADGAKQHNMAKVYAGYFEHGGHSVPTILIVKCGTLTEQSDAKPGNRGKRDSQIILMNFLSKVMFDDRMTPLEYDLFSKIYRICGVTPDKFEVVLMVDADTKVMPDSLPKMVNSMKNNPKIMGLCGETRIANKKQSWVTMIQVYEYFISHHLAKNFESLFGGVTCLPGCFSAYRIKSPKGEGYWVPILANPEIIEEYSQNVVTTLHQKNLLLLGEDRFLTTLMLRTFPKRQMIFIPQAACKTVVPDTFKVLLSQRRRWINSTIHNLMELVLVKDLCGTFCFSMQFVIFLELIGTIVLPAALIFTIILIVDIIIPKSDFVRESLLPLIMLLVILFLPALLIIVTTTRWVYVLWMFVYFIALPVWNFILPLYAFWHFDDFSWGMTRQVAGEIKGDHHGKKEGTFDASQIPMKTWSQWKAEENQKATKKYFPQVRRPLSPIMSDTESETTQSSEISSSTRANRRRERMHASSKYTINE